jgi:hypothetical protein
MQNLQKIKRKQKQKKREPTQLGRLSPTRPTSPARLSERSVVFLVSSFTSRNLRSWQLILPLLLPSNISTVSSRLQHKTYWKFSRVTVQGINFKFYGHNLPNQTGAPNATCWHWPPDLPPPAIIIRTERSTACSSFSSLIFVLKVSSDILCTSRANHANLSHKFEFIARCRLREWLSRRVLTPEYYLIQGLPTRHGVASCCRCWPRRSWSSSRGYEVFVDLSLDSFWQ